MLFATALLALAPLSLEAQGAQPAAPPLPSDGRIVALLQTLQVANSRELAPAINALLADTGTHMRMAPPRLATAADTARAAAVVARARAALGKYTDVAVAEKDGYVRFMPWLEEQAIFHYNHIGNGMASLNAFDAARPVSLLYQKDARGRMALVGAMYYAPPGATPDELDARLPLGIAHWHEHVDFCGPRVDPTRPPSEPLDGAALARWLAITTREACDAAGGRFVPRLFGWMAHAYLFGGDDPRAVWGASHDPMHVHH